ncbi:FecR domain-containing protein [Blastopirellula retiformator]|uniref:FecR protein n=1 Tax=Blastopirellula retiformator TaxID=2527970 RepID=A0A5C5V8X7_9BACT|nr:FecR domain-containing protein [Blastopirellula retiformator]TWT34423.1 FecR protein [Blastopirellula retiformator]
MTSFASEDYAHIPEHITNLVGRCVSGVASDLEWQELNLLLETDDDVLDFFVSYNELHAGLAMMSPKLASSGLRTFTTDRPGAHSRRLRWKSVIAWAGLAICLAGVLIAFRIGMPESGDVARCLFSTASDLRINGAPQFQREIDAGETLEFSDGTVGIALEAGIDLVVDGPAKLELVNRNRVRLVRGRLLADSQVDAELVYLETPNCVVSELGGRFGVSSFGGRPDQIAVFRGQMNISQGAHSHALRKGEAVRVASDGEISRLSSVVAGIFPNEADVNRTTFDKRVIESIGDNVQDESVYAFYHVAPNGFDEDMPAYADRDHQWNSIGPGGMPEFLRGAEYIMTLNDDIYHKLTRHLQIDLKLQRPAMVYVLYTECMYVPEWLSREFVDTGVLIGLDEGNGSRRPLGIGPNSSVDSNFKVWARKVEQPGVVILGGVDRRTYELPTPKYGGHNGGNMYGIVVTPLEN